MVFSGRVRCELVGIGGKGVRFFFVIGFGFVLSFFSFINSVFLDNFSCYIFSFSLFF